MAMQGYTNTLIKNWFLIAQRHLCQLLDGLLELQSSLSSKMGVASQDDSAQPTTSDDEEVPSDDEEGGETSGKATPPSLGKKRTRLWETDERRDYAEVIASGYETLRPYRNDVISKWNEKTKLATGKVTNKVSRCGLDVVYYSPLLVLSSHSWKWIAQ
jgi:hypothetical protein